MIGNFVTGLQTVKVFVDKKGTLHQHALGRQTIHVNVVIAGEIGSEEERLGSDAILYLDDIGGIGWVVDHIKSEDATVVGVGHIQTLRTVAAIEFDKGRGVGIGFAKRAVTQIALAILIIIVVERAIDAVAVACAAVQHFTGTGLPDAGQFQRRTGINQPITIFWVKTRGAEVLGRAHNNFTHIPGGQIRPRREDQRRHARDMGAGKGSAVAIIVAIATVRKGRAINAHARGNDINAQAIGRERGPVALLVNRTDAQHTVIGGWIERGRFATITGCGHNQHAIKHGFVNCLPFLRVINARSKINVDRLDPTARGGSITNRLLKVVISAAHIVFAAHGRRAGAHLDRQNLYVGGNAGHAGAVVGRRRNNAGGAGTVAIFILGIALQKEGARIRVDMVG